MREIGPTGENQWNPPPKLNRTSPTSKSDVDANTWPESAKRLSLLSCPSVKPGTGKNNSALATVLKAPPSGS